MYGNMTYADFNLDVFKYMASTVYIFTLHTHFSNHTM